jgi:hypothetical protein
VFVLVVSGQQPTLGACTGEYVPNRLRTRGGGGVLRDGAHAPQWNNRALWRFDDRYSWSGNGAAPADSVCLLPPNADGARRITYAAGLGQTNSYEENTTCCSVATDLIGYRKGAERWGVSPVLVCRAPLAVQAPGPGPATAAFPNPFETEVAVTFVLREPQTVALSLHDALGRRVLQQDATLLPAGSQRLSLATAGLPAGLYTLHLRYGPSRRYEVLKVLKTR